MSVRAAPATSTMGITSLGPGDTTAPGTIDRNNIGVSSYASRIDMQWKPQADDLNGPGLALVWITRNGSQVNAFIPSSGEFTDHSVAAGTTYNYSINDCDAFGNCSFSTFNATSAPSGSIDPRQTGIRPDVHHMGWRWGKH